MRTAIVYDRVNKWGGAERVLLALHELFPEAPLFTAIYNPKTARWAEVFPKVIPSFLNKITHTHHELLAPLMPLAFESFDFNAYDLVISVTSESAKGIITGPKTKHICYMLTPTRYLWSGQSDYFKNKFLAGISSPVVKHLKKWDKIASARPDKIIAISEEVQTRIKKYYNRDSQVIYPPVDTKIFHPSKNPVPHIPHYLLVSRLVSYKRVDIAIKAFNKLNLPLVIIGTGHEEKKLKKIANKNIKFINNLTDQDLVHYYNNCAALIFPQDEDFGLVAAEAQACGTPVIAFKNGGALDIIKDEKTGLFFESQTPESLIKAVKHFEVLKFDRSIITKHAQRFSKEKFNTEFMKAINNA